MAQKQDTVHSPVGPRSNQRFRGYMPESESVMDNKTRLYEMIMDFIKKRGIQLSSQQYNENCIRLKLDENMVQEFRMETYYQMLDDGKSMAEVFGRLVAFFDRFARPEGQIDIESDLTAVNFRLRAIEASLGHWRMCEESRASKTSAIFYTITDSLHVALVFEALETDRRLQDVAGTDRYYNITVGDVARTKIKIADLIEKAVTNSNKRLYDGLDKIKFKRSAVGEVSFSDGSEVCPFLLLLKQDPAFAFKIFKEDLGYSANRFFVSIPAPDKILVSESEDALRNAISQIENPFSDKIFVLTEKWFDDSHKNTDMQMDIGMMLAKKGKHESAIECFNNVLAVTNSADVHFKLANSYSELGRKKDSINHYKMAIALDPLLIAAYHNLGLGYGQYGEENKGNLAYYRDALSNLQMRVLIQEPESADAYCLIAFCYLKLEDPVKAIKYYKKALEIEPDHQDAKNGLMELTGEDGNDGNSNLPPSKLN